jgi:TonB family protein
MQAQVQGRVRVHAIVATDGTVHDARVVESLDPSLDEQALKTVSLWRFSPGTRNG